MDDERLITPDDPDFEGVELIAGEMFVHKVANAEHLRGKTWVWTRWEEIQPGWDHDHCHFCHEVRFSDRLATDLREGWATSGPAGSSVAEQVPGYHWVCPTCFEELRSQLDWSTATPPE